MNRVGNYTALSEVSTLLVLHSNNSVGIVQNVDEQGSITDILAYQSGIYQMLCMDSFADTFTKFYSNFYHQLKDPADYSFFKLRQCEARETAINLQNYIKSSSESEKKDLIDYAVSIETVNSIRNQKCVNSNSSGVGVGFNHHSSEFINRSQYRFQLKDVPLERLAEIGLALEMLENIGVLEDLQKGSKTRKLIIVILKNGDFLNTVDARLKLRLQQSLFRKHCRVGLCYVFEKRLRDFFIQIKKITLTSANTIISFVLYSLTLLINSFNLNIF